MATVILEYLSGSAFKLWNLQLQSYEAKHRTPSWSDFQSFINNRFGVIDPGKIARRKFENLKQTGNVFDYVPQAEALVQEMSPHSKVRPSQGEIFSRFTNNASSGLQDHLLKNEPSEGWSSPRQMFEAALRFATIERSKPRHDATPAPRKLAVHSKKISNYSNLPSKHSKSARHPRPAQWSNKRKFGNAGSHVPGANIRRAAGAARPTPTDPAPAMLDPVDPVPSARASKRAKPDKPDTDALLDRLSKDQLRLVAKKECQLHPGGTHDVFSCRQFLSGHF